MRAPHRCGSPPTTPLLGRSALRHSTALSPRAPCPHCTPLRFPLPQSAHAHPHVDEGRQPTRELAQRRPVGRHGPTPWLPPSDGPAHGRSFLAPTIGRDPGGRGDPRRGERTYPCRPNPSFLRSVAPSLVSLGIRSPRGPDSMNSYTRKKTAQLQSGHSIRDAQKKKKKKTLGDLPNRDFALADNYAFSACRFR